MNGALHIVESKLVIIAPISSLAAAKFRMVSILLPSYNVVLDYFILLLCFYFLSFFTTILFY